MGRRAAPSFKGEVLEIGISQCLERPPFDLSTGEQRRDCPARLRGHERPDRGDFEGVQVHLRFHHVCNPGVRPVGVSSEGRIVPGSSREGLIAGRSAEFVPQRGEEAGQLEETR